MPPLHLGPTGLSHSTLLLPPGRGQPHILRRVGEWPELGQSSARWNRRLGRWEELSFLGPHSVSGGLHRRGLFPALKGPDSEGLSTLASPSLSTALTEN